MPQEGVTSKKSDGHWTLKAVGVRSFGGVKVLCIVCPTGPTHHLLQRPEREEEPPQLQHKLFYLTRSHSTLSVQAALLP